MVKGKGLGIGRGMGRGRLRGNSAGPDGFCVCPKCDKKIKHRIGIPCYREKCPKCGTKMVRR